MVTSSWALAMSRYIKRYMNMARCFRWASVPLFMTSMNCFWSRALVSGALLKNSLKTLTNKALDSSLLLTSLDSSAIFSRIYGESSIC